jgi:glycoside hydrolase-like protein
MSGQPSAGIAATPRFYAATVDSRATDAACAHLSMIAKIVCAATSAQPLQLAAPEGASACPDSGPGVACGLSPVRNPDPGTASTPGGMTPCSARPAGSLPASRAACPDSAAPAAVPTPPVDPSVPIASLNSPKRIQLTVDATTEMPGRSALLTATTDRPVGGSGRAIEIFDASVGRLAGVCGSGITCQIAYSAHAGQHSFIAFVTTPTARMPSSSSAVVSNSVSVSWIAVSIVANRSVVGPGSGITLTATSTVAIDKTGWLLQLYDAPTHTRLTYCASGNTCSTTITQTSAGGRALVAVLAPPSSTAPPAELVVGQTDVFSLTWLSVAVRAVANSAQSGGVVHVVASVNADLKNTGWSIGIYESYGQLVAPVCSEGNSCVADVTISGAMPSFSAAVGSVASTERKIGRFLGTGVAGVKLTNIQAASGLVTPTVQTSRMLWGVDSCESFTDGIYPPVANQLGVPDFWGRYLTNTICPGISGDEVSSAHNMQMGILPIYNDFNCSNVVGYDTGRQYGAAAVAAAQGIGIPRGVALAIDIEPPGDACPGAANVDAGFINGWYDSIISANYVPAYYGNGGAGSEFANAYCAAVSSRPEVANNSHLWTFEASVWGGYSKSNRPDWSLAYNTHCPEHGTAWQYMLSAGSSPNVDQDLVSSDFPLWYP